eukprot:825729-Pelagomonas_calceolata.AAC.1
MSSSTACTRIPAALQVRDVILLLHLQALLQCWMCTSVGVLERWWTRVACDVQIILHRRCLPSLSAIGARNMKLVILLHVTELASAQSAFI